MCFCRKDYAECRFLYVNLQRIAPQAMRLLKKRKETTRSDDGKLLPYSKWKTCIEVATDNVKAAITDMSTLKKQRRMLAEWEPQRAVLLAWPHGDTDWKPYLDDIHDTYVDIIRAITAYEDVHIVAPDTARLHDYLVSHLSEKHLQRISMSAYLTDDTWARDFGHITVADANEATTGLFFRFNGWGEKFPASRDNNVKRHLEQETDLLTACENHDDFVLEGGSIESDGKGTVFTTRQCLLAPHRNQPLSQRQITARLKRTLGAERVVWLHHGQLIGDDTDGHIDTLVRIAPDDTIIYIACDDPDDAHYAELQALEKELRRLRTLDGKPYRLLSMPLPHAIEYDGERLPATYANYLVVNGAVLCPTYGHPEKDACAMATLQQAFPDRKVIGIDSTVIVRQHGSIHCLTMQYYPC